MRKRIFEIVEMGSRSDKASVIYDIVMLVAIVASIVPLMFLREYPVFHTIEVITVIFFIIDYLLRWITADYRLGKKGLSFVLYPFTENFAGLIYGADTAGLVSLIGSLASVINYRIYVREYPGKGLKFLKVFTLVSWAFFLLVVIPGLLLSRWDFFS